MRLTMMAPSLAIVPLPIPSGEPAPRVGPGGVIALFAPQHAPERVKQPLGGQAWALGGEKKDAAGEYPAAPEGKSDVQTYRNYQRN